VISALFYLNGQKILPERDLMPFRFPESSPLHDLSCILGKWLYHEDRITASGYYVKHMLNNRFDLWQLLLGSGLGDGVYKLRDIHLRREPDKVVMWLDDYEVVRLVEGNVDSFAKWAASYGLATKDEIISLSKYKGGRGFARIILTQDIKREMASNRTI